MGYLLPNIDDGQPPEEPVKEDKIKKIKWVQALTPYELIPITRSYENGATYLEPEHYTFAPYGGSDSEMTGKSIHSSRVIRFCGIFLPRSLYISNGYIHNSCLQPVYDVLQDYAMAMEACGYAIKEFSQGVYKMTGLASMMAAGNEAKIVARMRAVDSVRGIHKTIIMDEKESYDRVAGRFGGIGEIVSKLEKQLVAVSGLSLIHI